MEQLSLVTKEGQLFADSRDVAEMIGRPHYDLMKTIRSYIKYLGQGDFSYSDYFVESTYMNSQNKMQPHFLLTKIGCDLVANKMTGLKGTLFTAAYTKRFDEMEKQLQKKNDQQLPGTYKEALLQLIKEVEEKETLQLENHMYQQEIAENKPKITYVDEVLKSKDLMVTTQIAEDYGMSAKRFNQLLHKHGVQYKMNGQWLLYSKHKGNGYTKSETHTYNKRNGDQAVRMQSKWTQKGRLFLYELLKSKGILPTMEQMKMGLIEGGN